MLLTILLFVLGVAVGYGLAMMELVEAGLC
jgi:hypothetical protein